MYSCVGLKEESRSRSKWKRRLSVSQKCLGHTWLAIYDFADGATFVITSWIRRVRNYVYAKVVMYSGWSRRGGTCSTHINIYTYAYRDCLMWFGNRIRKHMNEPEQQEHINRTNKVKANKSVYVIMVNDSLYAEICRLGVI